MKKPLLIKLFSWLLMLTVGFGLGLGGVLAQEEAVAEAIETEMVEVMTEDSVEAEENGLVVAEAEKAVDYYLPYPGILPDHPFYWLKMIRDRVQLWLTNQPLAKAEKLLMYADKRLGAGWALIEGNKKELGVTTLTKGEKYLERVRAEAGKLGEGGDETRFKERLEKATKKHGQVLELLLEKTDGGQKEMIKQMLKLNEQVRETSEVEGGEIKGINEIDSETEELLEN